MDETYEDETPREREESEETGETPEEAHRAGEFAELMERIGELTELVRGLSGRFDDVLNARVMESINEPAGDGSNDENPDADEGYKTVEELDLSI